MKPTYIIYIDNKLGCISFEDDEPTMSSEDKGYAEAVNSFNEKLDNAKKNVIFFENQKDVQDALLDYIFDGYTDIKIDWENVKESFENMIYPIPYFYDIKIEGGYSNPEWNPFYAVLVPNKERQKGILIDLMNESYQEPPYPYNVEYGTPKPNISIMFANWIKDNGWRKHFETFDWERTFAHSEPEIKTTEELFEMFKKENEL